MNFHPQSNDPNGPMDIMLDDRRNELLGDSWRLVGDKGTSCAAVLWKSRPVRSGRLLL